MVTILTLKVWKVSVWKSTDSHFVQKDPQVTCAFFFPGHPLGSQEGTCLGTVQSSETGSDGRCPAGLWCSLILLASLPGPWTLQEEGRPGRQA